MAKWSGNRDRNTPLRHRALQRAAMIGIRSAISIRARGQWPHPEAVYMTAPRSVCRNTKKALAERGPSIHDGGLARPPGPLVQPARHLMLCAGLDQQRPLRLAAVHHITATRMKCAA